MINKDANIVENNPDLISSLYAPCSTQRLFSNGWATLQIDMSMKTLEQREKIYQAEMLLREAGISFDTGSGGGNRDWELDWSLSGATLKIKPIYCLCNKHKTNEPLSYIYWQVYRTQEGKIVSYAYCSKEAREEDRKAKGNSGENSWESIIEDEERGI